jgi:hypothetical protein
MSVTTASETSASCLRNRDISNTCIDTSDINNIMQRLQPHHLEYLLSCVCDVGNIRDACATATPYHLHQQPQQFRQQLQ